MTSLIGDVSAYLIIWCSIAVFVIALAIPLYFLHRDYESVKRDLETLFPSAIADKKRKSTKPQPINK